MLKDLLEVITLALFTAVLFTGILEIINTGIRWLNRRSPKD